MKLLSKEEVLNRYKSEELGYLDYKKDASYFVEDFINEEWAIDFVSELSGRDCDITANGARFLLDYYDLRDLIKKIKVKWPGFPDGDETEEEALRWLVEHIVERIVEG